MPENPLKATVRFTYHVEDRSPRPFCFYRYHSDIPCYHQRREQKSAVLWSKSTWSEINFGPFSSQESCLQSCPFPTSRLLVPIDVLRPLGVNDHIVLNIPPKAVVTQLYEVSLKNLILVSILVRRVGRFFYSLVQFNKTNNLQNYDPFLCTYVCVHY